MIRATTFLKLVLLFVLLTIPLAASAATYYIDSTGGNDANSGISDTSPWQTISRIQNTASFPGMSSDSSGARAIRYLFSSTSPG